MRWRRELAQQIQERELTRGGLSPLGSCGAATAMVIAAVTGGFEGSFELGRMRLCQCMMARHRR
jgi:hypothetical protein